MAEATHSREAAQTRAGPPRQLGDEAVNPRWPGLHQPGVGLPTGPHNLRFLQGLGLVNNTEGSYLRMRPGEADWGMAARPKNAWRIVAQWLSALTRELQVRVLPILLAEALTCSASVMGSELVARAVPEVVSGMAPPNQGRRRVRTPHGTRGSRLRQPLPAGLGLLGLEHLGML